MYNYNTDPKETGVKDNNGNEEIAHPDDEKQCDPMEDNEQYKNRLTTLREMVRLSVLFDTGRNCALININRILMLQMKT